MLEDLNFVVVVVGGSGIGIDVVNRLPKQKNKKM